MAGRQIIDKIDDDLELLIRHIKMLRAIKDNEPIGIIRLSEITELPKHKIRYSLRLLEKDGVISPSPEGAVTTDRYEQYMAEIRAYIGTLRGIISDLESALPATL